jgi:HPt (histidine-containing phosphotransfer) domain-containing protein
MNATAIRQQIIESLANLSGKQLLQIRELIEQNFLPQIKPKSEEERQQLIKSLQGKYAHAPTSSEDFAQQKQAEIDWEERNR